MKVRAYRMAARAQAAERTRRRILDAAVALFSRRDFAEVTLDAVAAEAGVTLQTVLRRFASKERLFAEAARERAGEVMAAREPARPGDTRSALRALARSYEAIGDLNWRLLRQEHLSPAVAELLATARRLHRAWLAGAFARLLPARGRERERRLDLLFAATDFYVWKLCRRDLGLAPAATVDRMASLVGALERTFGEEA
jgi:AcrR family transcriptional regulator